MATELPKFDMPPAVETMMGFHFAPLRDWHLLRLGQFFEHVKSRYPQGRVADSVGMQETQPTFSEIGQMPLRAILSSQKNDELLQVQTSAFLRNWRKTQENTQYTHYAQLRPRFEEDWIEFNDFLLANEILPPVVFQAEVTYVNHLVRGRDWDSYNDLARLVKLFAARNQDESQGRRYDFLPEAANVALSVGYSLPEKGLTVQVNAQSAVTMPEGSDVLQLTVTAKGAPPPAMNLAALMATLDRCHDAVILSFDDVTTANAHTRWGKQ